MTAILSLIMSRFAGPIASGLCLVLLVFGLVQCSEKRHEAKRADKAEATLKVTKADLGTCHTNTANLEASLKAQNAAVDALKREGEARVAESAKAVSAARSVAEKARREAAAILAERPKGDVCASADELILREVGR